MAIKINPKHKGLLHEDLGIEKDEPITVGQLMRAKHADSPSERKRATFAINARKWGK